MFCWAKLPTEALIGFFVAAREMQIGLLSRDIE
jgi:hypothetical protein